MDIALRFDYGEDKLADLPLEELIAFVLASRKLPQTTSVSVTFVSNKRIHELNRDYRGIDKPTDVLSFECDNIPFEGEAIDQNEEYELGDVIIATDVAIAQTAEFGTTLEEEVSLLITHGLLHLCGYDHIEEAEALEMEALEDELLERSQGELACERFLRVEVRMAFKDSDFTFIASVRCALKGVRFASRERNFRIDIVCALITIILGFVCQISAFEWLVVVACFGLVLGGEALNSALEYIVDLASPDYHVLAGKAKDCAAGAVLLFAAASFVIGCIIFIPKLLALVFGA